MSAQGMDSGWIYCTWQALTRPSGLKCVCVCVWVYVYVLAVDFQSPNWGICHRNTYTPIRKAWVRPCWEALKLHLFTDNLAMLTRPLTCTHRHTYTHTYRAGLDPHSADVTHGWIMDSAACWDKCLMVHLWHCYNGWWLAIYTHTDSHTHSHKHIRRPYSYAYFIHSARPKRQAQRFLFLQAV